MRWPFEIPIHGEPNSNNANANANAKSNSNANANANAKSNPNANANANAKYNPFLTSLLWIWQRHATVPCFHSRVLDLSRASVATWCVVGCYTYFEE